MFGWLRRKSISLPPVLYWKDGEGAFRYCCEYFRHEAIREHAVRIGLVDPLGIRVTTDGFQSAWVMVADERPFRSRAITAAPDVPSLRGGELVKWFAVKPEPQLAAIPELQSDPRSWWQAWIVAVYAPELIIAKGQFRVAVDYRGYVRGRG